MTRTVGALSVSRLANSDTSGPACCPVEKCYGMALHRVEIAGWPAGFLCVKCAKAWLDLWAELSGREVVQPKMARKAAA